jgi:hypothetical protein
LLHQETEKSDEKDLEDPVLNEQTSAQKKLPKSEKWKGQIEKVVLRTV